MPISTRAQARVVVAVASAGCLGAAIALGVGVGGAAVAVAAVAGGSAVAGGLAALASVLHERIRAAERALAGERARATGAPMPSGPRPAGTDARAADRSFALAAAHEMAGPVAAIRANVDWVEERLREGRLTIADPEARVVLAETRAAVETLVRALGDLRRPEVGKRTSTAADRTSARPQVDVASGK